ncbi:MAG: ABC transporter permease [Syntrophomonadaceae bacterium]|jgi:hypothetical protein
MQANRFNMFAALYGKEMRELLAEITIVVLLAIVVNVVLFFRLDQSPFRYVLFVPNMMLFGLACFLPFISSFKLIYREWRSNTIYMLLSLPVKGASVLGAKLAALLTQYVIGSLAVMGTCLLLVLALMGPEFSQGLQELCRESGLSTSQLLGEGLLLYMLSIAVLIYLVSISFGSQMVGKLVRRYSGLLTIVVFIALYSTMQKLIGLFWNQVDLHFNIGHAYSMSIGVINQYLGLALLSLLSASALLYAGTIWIYNRRIEL